MKSHDPTPGDEGGGSGSLKGGSDGTGGRKGVMRREKWKNKYPLQNRVSNCGATKFETVYVYRCEP